MSKARTRKTKSRHKLGFYVEYFLREYLLGFPGILLEKVVLWGGPFANIHGLRILDPRTETREHFVRLVGAALEMIMKTDRVRFARVKTEIRIIVNSPSAFTSVYGRVFRTSHVDLRSFYSPARPDLAVRFLASVLVRDATYGHLVKRGILRTRQNRRRFDSLCAREAKRFLLHFGSETTPWDQENLDWDPEGKRLRAQAKEVKDVFGRNPAAEAELWKNLQRHKENGENV